jgi:hypothetical protein
VPGKKRLLFRMPKFGHRLALFWKITIVCEKDDGCCEAGRLEKAWKVGGY